jgi:hypothetical protein
METRFAPAVPKMRQFQGERRPAGEVLKNRKKIFGTTL